MAGPEIHARGFAEDDAVFDEILPADRARRWPRRSSRADADSYQLQQVVRRVVGRWVGGKLRRRPMIIPVVVSA